MFAEQSFAEKTVNLSFFNYLECQITLLGPTKHEIGIDVSSR